MYSIQFAVYGTALATRTWLRDRISDRGATAVEYGLLVGLIAVVIAVAVTVLGSGLNGLFGSTANCINGVAKSTVTVAGVGNACPGA